MAGFGTFIDPWFEPPSNLKPMLLGTWVPLLACQTEAAASLHDLHLGALLLRHGFPTRLSHCVWPKVGDKAGRSSTCSSQRAPVSCLPPSLEKRFIAESAARKGLGSFLFLFCSLTFSEI